MRNAAQKSSKIKKSGAKEMPVDFWVGLGTISEIGEFWEYREKEGRKIYFSTHLQNDRKWCHFVQVDDRNN